MKFIYTVLMLVYMSLGYSAMCQSYGINFQGVARNSNNVLLSSQKISLRLTIISSMTNGNSDYSETRAVNTNQQGAFSLIIGDTGTITKTGNFDTINWANYPKYLKVEMDPNAGTSFTLMGITQLQYVPYSYYANSVNAKNISGILPISSGGTGTSIQSFVDLSTSQTIAGDKKFTGITSLSNSLTGGNTASSNISGFTASINSQTVTSYTLQTSDNGKIVTFNNSNLTTVLVPQSLPIGFNCMIAQLGSGQVTITSSSGVNIFNRYGFLKTSGQYSVATLISLALNSFILTGDLTN